jgi:hypothetical protein
MAREKEQQPHRHPHQKQAGNYFRSQRDTLNSWAAKPLARAVSIFCSIFLGHRITLYHFDNFVCNYHQISWLKLDRPVTGVSTTNAALTLKE